MHSRQNLKPLLWVLAFSLTLFSFNQGFTLHNMEFGKRMLQRNSIMNRELEDLMVCVNKVNYLLKTICQQEQRPNSYGQGAFQQPNYSVLSRGPISDYQDMDRSLNFLRQCCNRDCGFESLYSICKY